MHLQRSEFQQIYQRNMFEFAKSHIANIIFFLTHYFGDTLRLIYEKVRLICIYNCRQLHVFPEDSF